MEVPLTVGAGCISPNSPFSMVISAPSALLLAETIFTCETDAILASASPRKPRVSIMDRSSILLILLVL